MLKKVITVSVPEELKRNLSEKARKNLMSLSQYLVAMMMATLTEEEREEVYAESKDDY